jgi:hypothetical protein
VVASFDDPNASYVFGSEDEDDEDNEDDESIDIEDIDLQALAEEVVALLKQELRLEGERWGWHRVW